MKRHTREEIGRMFNAMHQPDRLIYQIAHMDPDRPSPALQEAIAKVAEVSRKAHKDRAHHLRQLDMGR